MVIRKHLLALIILTAAPSFALPGESAEAIGPAPAERTERVLAQVEAIVDGPRELAGSLAHDDFRLFVTGRPVELIAVDRLCRSGLELAPTDEIASSLAQSTPPGRASYLLYFDQHNLTMEGRETSIALAKEMVEELVGKGSRAAIVSAGDRLLTVSEFSGAVGELQAALDALRKDNSQWDEYPTLEHNRYRRIMEAGWSSAGAACAMARSFQNDEITRTEGALELFSSVLARFLGEEPPKVAIYFGDTTRIKAGRHYFAVAGVGCDRNPFDALSAFQRVTQDAAAFGVRVYAVQAAGLTDSNFASRTAQGWATQDSHGGLKALALDTGGDAFLNGASVETMVGRLNADSDCLYVLNFDPRALPKDTALTVRVEVDSPGVRVRSRSQLVIQSDSTRKTAELLAAFTAPESVKSRLPMNGAVVPIEFDKGRFRALVQAIIPASTLPTGGEWDIGMSLVFGSVVRNDESGRISVDRAGVPVVLESEMTFRPGPFDILFVGHETRSGEIAAGQFVGEWPRRKEQPVITEIAIVQPTPGVFLRSGKVRTNGSLSVPSDGSIRGAAPIAMLSLVCRPVDRKKALTVERAITGESVVEFPPLELPSDSGPCTQVRDIVPENTLAAGNFSYSVRIKGSGVKRSREFRVVGQNAAAQ